MTNVPDIPGEILSIPGVLQEVVEYYNNTAIKPQPQFAVAAAIILGATVMGRRYCTDVKNYTSLYIVLVSRTSTGKEHGKWVTDELLTAAGLPSLIGSGGYTSSGGVISALLTKPCHLAVIDELGRVMKSTNMDGNSNKMDVHTVFMELFGRLDGVFRPPQYSTLTLSENQRKELANRDVSHPALSLLAMTTPSTLYQALNSSFVKDGFLPRFIIVESKIRERQLTRMVKPIKPPIRVLDWMKKCASTVGSSGNVSNVVTAQLPPSPKMIPFNSDCIPLLEEYETELNRLMDQYEDVGLDGMFGKSRELAQRISLIVAVSCGSSKIKSEHVKWAISFVDYYNRQTVNRLSTCMSDSQFEAEIKEVYSIISNGGAKGATHRELERKSRLFRGMDEAKATKVMNKVMHFYGVQLVDVPHEGAGAPRRAFVAEEFL